jgi:hypothetical protein
MNRRLFVPVLVVSAWVGALDAAAQEKDLIAVELGARGFFGEANGRLRSAPGVSHVRIDEDLDAAGDMTGAGLSFTGHLRGGHTFNVQGWQYASSGEAVQSETQVFGDITLPAGGSASTDVDVRYVSAKFVYGVTKEHEPFRVGLGVGGKVLDWKTDVSLDTGERENMKMRIIYPAAELELSYRIGEALELKAEGSFGLPAFEKNGLEIQNPIEARGGLRLMFGGFTVEVGYQVIDALIVENENQVDESSASVNLSGVYFEIAARF